MKRAEKNELMKKVMLENEQLKAQIAGGAPIAPAMLAIADPKELALMNDAVPQEFRDRAACYALIKTNYSVPDAFLEMGISTAAMSASEKEKLSHKLFGNERVRALLHSTMAPLEKVRDQVIARQTSLALYGTADESSRAASILAKLGGWNKAQKLDIRTQGVSIHTILRENPDELIASLDAFSHEPGAPVKAGVLGAAKEPTTREQTTIDAGDE